MLQSSFDSYWYMCTCDPLSEKPAHSTITELELEAILSIQVAF